MSDSSSGGEEMHMQVITCESERKKDLKSKKERDALRKKENPEEEGASDNEGNNEEGEGSAEDEKEEVKTFKELGVSDVLAETCERLGWTEPSQIQRLTLPSALQGRDIIGLAETGSGKTGAFALPVLQSLLESHQKLFCLVLTPTRELAFQVGQQFEALGSSIGLLVAVIVGGVDSTTQAIALARRPHIVVATPGRLVDHLENTKGFSLRSIRYLIMDEADRMLNMDFEVEIDKILKTLPRERRTYLFSATMTKKVAKLERACLRDPVRIEVNTRYKTVDKLKQHYLFIPHKYKEAYLIYILNELAGQTSIIFTSTCNSAMIIALLLRQLGMSALPLHGKMTQQKRLGALNAFKSKKQKALVCTDVAARGLDIPHVDVVINFDVPQQAKDYVHRVGRTARAGRSGLAVTLVTQYDVEMYQRIEVHLGKKLAEYPCVDNDVMLLVERTSEALLAAKVDLKEKESDKKKGKRNLDDSDEEGGNKYRKRVKVKKPEIKNKLEKKYS